MLGLFVLYEYVNDKLRKTDCSMFGTEDLYEDWLRVLKEVKVKGNDGLLLAVQDKMGRE